MKPSLHRAGPARYLVPFVAALVVVLAFVLVFSDPPLVLFVMALTIVSPTALKLRIGNDFAGRPSFFSPTMWLLAIVFALFAAWFFLGNQTGLGGSIQPVEAGKFAIVVLLGAMLAQWLIRARLLAQAWFGITLIGVVLSVLFITSLLFVPAVKSDYSPLIIISSATGITAVVGVMAIGWRIRNLRVERPFSS